MRYNNIDMTKRLQPKPKLASIDDMCVYDRRQTKELNEIKEALGYKCDQKLFEV